MEAVEALWNSGEEAAVLVDQETPRYADHPQVHTVRLRRQVLSDEGAAEHHSWAARRPVIVQAGASPAPGGISPPSTRESMLAHGTSIVGMKAFRAGHASTG